MAANWVHERVAVVLRARSGAVLAGIACALAASVGTADPLVYEPSRDPGLGFNLISWRNYGDAGAAIWRSAVRDIYAHGFRHVSLSPLRFFDPGTGAIAATSDSAPELAHIAAAADEADRLGITVTLNPFVEPEGFAFWRGQWNPSRQQRMRFWADYETYIREVAELAERHHAERLTIGTELRAITQNIGNNVGILDTIEAAAAEYSGSIGYAANFDEYTNDNLTATVWEHPAVDFIGVDAYFGLTTDDLADASGPHPDETFISTIRERWTGLLDEQILPFAAARKGGDGMEVVFTEHGLIPFNRTTVTPWNYANGENAVDQAEQVNGYQALVEALEGRRDRLGEVYLWQWGMPGAAGSYWYLHPSGVDVPGTGFDEGLGAQAAQFLANYIQTGLNVPGDANGDGTVDLVDLNAVRNHFGEHDVDIEGDVNGDDTVDLEDLNLVRNHFGESQPPVTAPEGAALWLALASLAGLYVGGSGRLRAATSPGGPT